MSGALTISLEIELAWGTHDKDSNDRFHHISPRREVETRTLNNLLELCEDLEIPITFDVVGHLFLSSCDGSHPSPHEGNWFASDPGTDEELDPLFYAPDIVKNIRDAEVEHEIATHTFSHTLLSDASDEVVEWELEEVNAIHEAYGIPAPESIVPPRHDPPDYETLRENGIKNVRMPKQRENLPSSKVEAYVDYVMREPLVSDPEVVDGVVVSYCDSYCSLSSGYLPYGQIDPHWIFQLHPKLLRQHVHRKFLLKGAKKAERMDSFAHYWSHLYNISNETTWDAVKSGLEDIAAYRDQSNLDVLTLEQVGEIVRKEEQ